jgi:hypothetical protein
VLLLFALIFVFFYCAFSVETVLHTGGTACLFLALWFSLRTLRCVQVLYPAWGGVEVECGPKGVGGPKGGHRVGGRGAFSNGGAAGVQWHYLQACLGCTSVTLDPRPGLHISHP